MRAGPRVSNCRLDATRWHEREACSAGGKSERARLAGIGRTERRATILRAGRPRVGLRPTAAHRDGDPSYEGSRELGSLRSGETRSSPSQPAAARDALPAVPACLWPVLPTAEPSSKRRARPFPSGAAPMTNDDTEMTTPTRLPVEISSRQTRHGKLSTLCGRRRGGGTRMHRGRVGGVGIDRRHHHGGHPGAVA